MSFLNSVFRYRDAKKIERIIGKNNIDFLDFGCSKGGSIDFASRRFGGNNGLGIDISSSKVSAAIENGYSAINFDLHNLPKKELVDFCILSHFLEHVPSRHDVESFIESAIRVSRDFVYIQQPFFDKDGYLLEKGIKLSWSDWSCHPNRMTSLDLWSVLRDLSSSGLKFNFSILAYGEILSSNEKYILDINSPKNYLYKEEDNTCIDGIKLEGVYKETICLITKPHIDHKKLLTKCRYNKILHKNIVKFKNKA